MKARPRLSIVGITHNSAERLERWAELAREFADDISLLVDSSSDRETLDMARKVADQVQIVEHAPFVEYAMDWGLRAARGQWVLWLDDDEILDPRFGDIVDELLADPDVTHYWQPYRWIVEKDGEFGWLGAFPWYPDRRLRLLRRVGSVFSHRGRLHSPIDVAGEGLVLTDERSAIYHLNFLLADRESRERKVRRYTGHSAPSCGEYYLWEDYDSTTPVLPLPHQLVARGISLVEPGRRPVAFTPISEQDAEGMVSLPLLRATLMRHQPERDVFSAAYSAQDLPVELLPNRGYTALLDITNTSSSPWRNTGPEKGRIELSYHWISPEYGTLIGQGDVTLLTRALDPGERITAMPAGLWTPYEPGDYLLEWDLRCTGEAWFSERGVPPLQVRVRVRNDEDQRSREIVREVARLPARARVTPETPAAARDDRPEQSAPAGIAARFRSLIPRRPPSPRFSMVPQPSESVAAANLTPIPPARILDTRNGTGAPGAPHGPVAAGTVFSLNVASHPDIPRTAIGIVGTLSIPHADYNGFATVRAADGLSPAATVSMYFRDDGHPAAGQVTAGLGTGVNLGELVIRLSDNAQGHAELIFDVTGYLD